MSQEPSYALPEIFLMDGIRKHVSPGALLVADKSIASDVANRMIEVGLAELQPATPGAGLMTIKSKDVSRISADGARGICTYAQEKGHWLFLKNIDRLLESPGGRALIEIACEEMAEGTLPCMLVSTPPSKYEFVSGAICRIIGLAPAVRWGSTGEFEGFDDIVYFVKRTMDKDPANTGWLISVRYSLLSPVGTTYDSVAPESDYALPMLDNISFLSRDKNKPATEPDGAIVSLTSDSFQASQQVPAFTAAEKLARRAIGRQLALGERVEARRGIYYI
jgi:hypothetical protein